MLCLVISRKLNSLKSKFYNSTTASVNIFWILGYVAGTNADDLPT